MKTIRKYLPLIALVAISLALCIHCQSQTHVFPALDTANVFTGTNQFIVGVQLGPVAFAALPTPPVNGNAIYCSNCIQATVCAAGGTGAMALYINGAWSCTAGAAGGGGGVTGSGTTNLIPIWTGATSLGNSSITDSAGTLSTTDTIFQFATAGTINTPASSTPGGITISAGANNGVNGAGAPLSLNSGAGIGTGNGGNVSITTGNGGASGTAGTMTLGGRTVTLSVAQNVPGSSVLISAFSGLGSAISPNSGQGAAWLTAGTGAPTFNCVSAPMLYLRADPSSTSTFLYICISGTWTAVTVP